MNEINSKDKGLDQQTEIQDDKIKSVSFSDFVLKKKFRLSDFLAEKIITSVAFLSIAIIILIFVFVFREALPIFFSNEKKTETQIVTDSTTGISSIQELKKNNSNEEQIPERYGVIENIPLSDNDTSSNNLKTTSSTTANADNNSENKAAVKTLLGTEWQPVSDNPRYGMLPLFLGTLKLTLIAILFAAPLGILAAIFTCSFAPKWLREIVKPTIELLAGFPSVVIGFFALMVMATFFQEFFGYESRLNGFVGGIAMALAAIPIIFTIAEDALSAVPETYKEASLALGASKWQTAFFVTLPAATPGIFAAILLGVGRVFGETMIALMATGNAAILSMNPFDSVRALSATIGAEMAEVVFGDTHYNVLFLIGSLLFIFTFILNVIAEFYVKGKLVKRFQGTKA